MKFTRYNPFPINPRRAKKVKNIIMMGDSLSDRGTINKTVLWGCIPMSYLSDLQGHSPDGRFTNGLVWSDHVLAEIANDFTLKRLQKKWRVDVKNINVTVDQNRGTSRVKVLKKKWDLDATDISDGVIQGDRKVTDSTIKRLQKKWHLDCTDISDAIIRGDRKILDAIRTSYSLDNDNFVRYDGKLWVRTYCLGGLTAHDYSWNLSTSIVRFFTRLIVSKLAQVCTQLLDYDKGHGISHEQKAETLVIEWSGANDLITVNARPSIEEVDKAIAARVNNVRRLIAAGYRNFVLFNLADISLTPRYQNLSVDEQTNAKNCSDYFNEQLKNACEQLNEEYPHCSIDPFDINTMFRHIYENPEHYQFDKDKIKTPYLKSKEFDDPSDGSSPSRGYMFYDDVHPTADMHALLSAYFYDQLERRYELLEPTKPRLDKCEHLSERTLLHAFRQNYERKLAADQSSFFQSSRSRLNYRGADLNTVFRHALRGKGTRTLEVLKSMGWLSSTGELIVDEPELKKAMKDALETPQNALTPLIST